jgi:hypothetical protein
MEELGRGDLISNTEKSGPEVLTFRSLFDAVRLTSGSDRAQKNGERKCR